MLAISARNVGACGTGLTPYYACMRPRIEPVAQAHQQQPDQLRNLASETKLVDHGLAKP